MANKMTLENRLNITDSADLAREERISKKKAAQLFDRKLLDTFDVGTFAGLAAIHISVRWILATSMRANY